MADIRTNLRITVDGAAQLVQVEKALESIGMKADKAQSSMGKVGATRLDGMTSSVSGLASKVDGLSGGMFNLSGIVSKMTSPWALAGAAITGAAFAMGKAIQEGSKLADLSAKFRMSTDDLQRLGDVGALSGVTMEQFADGITKLRMTMGKTPEKFRELGIEVEKWKGLGSVELAYEFAKAMEGIKDSSNAAAVGTELATEGFRTMAAALKSEDLKKAMESQVALTAEQVRQADELGDAWERVKQKIAQAAGVVKGVAVSAAHDALLGPGGKPAGNAAYFGPNMFAPVNIPWAKPAAEAAAAKAPFVPYGPAAPDIGEIYQQNKLDKESQKLYEARQKERLAADKKFSDQELDLRANAMKEEEKLLEDYNKKQDKLEEEARANSMKAEDDAQKAAAEADKKELEAKISRREKMHEEIDKADMKAADEQRAQGRKGMPMSGADWAEYNAGFNRAIDKAQRMGQLFGTLREGLSAMGVSANSFAMTMAVGLEMGAASRAQMLASMKTNDKLGMASAGAGALMGAYQSGSALGGAATGAMVGSALGKEVPGLGFLGKYGGAVVGGLVGGIAGLFGKKSHKKEMQEKYKDTSAGDFFSQMAAKTEYATKDFLTLMNAAKGTAQHTQWINQNLDLAAGGVGKMVDAMQYLGKDGAVAVAGTFSSSFWATMKNKGLAAATETFGPIFDKVMTQLGEMGLDPASMGMDKIQRLMTIAQDPKTAALLGAVGGNTDYIKGMLNSGYMTDDALSNSGKVASATYNELKNQGLTTKESYEQMADYLSAVQRASEASGKAIPEELQRMIDEAKANGIEFTKQPIDQLAGYTKEIRDFLLGKGISSGGSSSGSTAGSGGSATYDEATGEVQWGPRPSGYPGGAPWPPVPMARGGWVPARRGGTAVILGEGGEGESVVPASQGGGGGMGGGLTVVLGGPSFTPLNTAESQRDLVRFNAEENVRMFRESPTVRYALGRTAKRWAR